MHKLVKNIRELKERCWKMRGPRPWARCKAPECWGGWGMGRVVPSSEVICGIDVRKILGAFGKLKMKKNKPASSNCWWGVVPNKIKWRYSQGYRLSGKPGNVREYDSCQANVRKLTKNWGNMWDKTSSGNMVRSAAKKSGNFTVPEGWPPSTLVIVFFMFQPQYSSLVNVLAFMLRRWSCSDYLQSIQVRILICYVPV